MSHKYCIIVAASQNNVIGSQGKIPWNLPEDMSRFKRLTRGHTVVMGRKTYESIGRPLPARNNIVITSDPNFSVPGVTVMRSVEETKNVEGKIWYIGGEGIYKEALTFAEIVFLTRVHKTVEGDAFFPAIDLSRYEILAEADLKENDTNFSFINLVRL